MAEGPGRTLSFADDVLVYRKGKNREETARSVQEELDRIGEWCEQHNGKLNPGKAGVLWATLDNRSVRAEMPSVSISDIQLQREEKLKYLGITFDRTLSGKEHITNITDRARKGLVALRVMATASMPQRALLIFFQAVVLSVIEYGLGLLTLSKTQLQRLEVIQNEGMRTVLGCTRDTSTAAMRHLLDLPTMPNRHKLAQIKAYLRVTADVEHPLHQKIGNQVRQRIKRGSSWMVQAERTLETCCRIEDIRRGCDWIRPERDMNNFMKVIATLGRECREWPINATNAEIETIIEEKTRPGDAVIFTDGSVSRGQRSGWAFSARVDGRVVGEKAGAFQCTTSSMAMEVKAVTEALSWAGMNRYTHVLVATDSMSTLDKIRSGWLYSEWVDSIEKSRLNKITWLFCPGHAGVRGNERADELAGKATLGGRLTLDPPVVLAQCKESLNAQEEEESFTLSLLAEKCGRGAGRRSETRGQNRRVSNQLLMETISRRTLEWTLQRREEQIWTCADCWDANSANK